MQVVIEFYRTREIDGAHAVVGRETAQVADLEDAMALALRLSFSLAMPQLPDAMAITDAAGVPLYSGVIDVEAAREGRSWS